MCLQLFPNTNAPVQPLTGDTDIRNTAHDDGVGDKEPGQALNASLSGSQLSQADPVRVTAAKAGPQADPNAVSRGPSIWPSPWLSLSLEDLLTVIASG